MNDTIRVAFEPMGQAAEMEAGASVMDAARLAGVALSSVCGGEGTCGRCRVAVTGGEVGDPVDADRRALSRLELDAGQRLACRTHPVGDVTITVPRASLIGEQRLQIGGAEPAGAPAAPGSGERLAPAVRALAAPMERPSLADQRGDLDRLVAALRTAHGVHSVRATAAAIGQLTRTAREHDWDVIALLHGRDLVGVLPPGQTAAGLAVDLGTTKVAGYLIDLETGAELAAAGVMNPQIAYGEDVISRLAYAERHPGGDRVLADVIRRGLDDLAGELAGQAGIGRDQIAEAVIVANTAMHHLLFGLPTRQLSVAPFVAATASPFQAAAADLQITLAPGALVHAPPCVGGFVGADAVAMMLGTDLDTAAGVVICVDIGTNTEIALRDPRRAGLTATSCASGPAFEGAHIRDGMRAANGAIEGVEITPGGIRLRVIGDAPPAGICGSGIIDAIAELRKTGAINLRGRFDKNAPGVRPGRDGLEYPLAQAGPDGSGTGTGTGTGTGIAVTQNDVNEIQLAKGAVQAAITALLDATGTDPADVDTMILAGAFGTFLNLGSALGIGLLPRLPNAEYRQVGNAAGLGARIMLRSLKERARARQIATTTGYLELTTLPGFQGRFARAMLLPLPDPTPSPGRP